MYTYHSVAHYILKDVFLQWGKFILIGDQLSVIQLEVVYVDFQPKHMKIKECDDVSVCPDPY